MALPPYKSSPNPPVPAYLPDSPSSILHPPTELYSRIAATASPSTPNQRELVSTLTIPPRSGAAWQVPAGSVFRLSTPAGPQVGDLNVWSAANARERFWASRTRQLHASHVSTGDRLWSCLPYMRPLCGIVADSLGREGLGRWGTAVGDGDGKDKGVELGEKGRSRWGGRCHDLLGTRCDPYVNRMLTGRTYNYHCHSNLVRAVLPYGLNESDVHDVLNVFQVTGLDEKGRYFMEASPSQPDDFIEFFAEQDLLCALSTCPGGDLSEWGWVGVRDGETEEGEGARKMKETCRPIKVEVFKIADHVRDQVLEEWVPPAASDYAGCHGLGVPLGEKRE
ncbi:Rhamnolipids biosynthesis 3-oxoacyl-(acyl-carrier-protein) reductase [Lasiodiplodia theobromae]|uniref:Rhamnolipids biosynthesis 3-oxoacyl-(acyl-carrier-protein) reductase n=1 Tax=Lasiodiplodia theobromae TaxID=45133 RepID=UPI0015C2C717|nr:Rhamnolipids biosynthesis 3-oxoacyl-(acyl-carrier-protein) reductase [Lasiodiplodia theobromae]KAF4535395.1 Rhamnolipids biosynthesis 3-oxoacyl-(acyl-carrier-protein) reductase [Lasiodiplodia theobromae]